ncbi:MAG: asparaginase, partial [Actinobacteria bacterium]|nr:asparaginase [Actinomycetota bacterium]
YLNPDHPVQVAMNEAVAAACGVEPELAADNCGMTTHRVPLASMALAYARLGVGWEGISGLDRVAAAMRANPYVVRQRGEIDSELIARSRGRMIAKVAAEAGVGVGTSDGVGVAVRIVDGSPRAWAPATMAAVHRWIGRQHDDPVFEELAAPTLRDGASRPLGSMVAVWGDDGSAG